MQWDCILFRFLKANESGRTRGILAATSLRTSYAVKRRPELHAPCNPIYAGGTVGPRTVLHAGFAAIQDDIAFWGSSVVVSTRDPWAQHGLNQICELVGGELIAFDVSHQLSLAINDGCVQGMIHQAFIGEIIDPE